MRLALLPPLVALLSCVSPESRAPQPAPRETVATLRRLGAMPAPVAGDALSARLPERASAALRIGEGDVWLEVTPVDMGDVTGAYIDGATVYPGARPDLDLVYVRDHARVEELRLARTHAAAAHAAWNLRKGPGIATIQVVDGRIEAVDHKAIVRLRSEPAFAIDANGTRRAMRLALRGSTVEADLDVEGLATPIAIDPAWVAAAAPSGVARVITPLVKLSTGKVLLAGGQIVTTGANVSTAEVYDPVTNTWAATANNMSVPRSEHTATAHGGTSKKVVLVGGYNTSDISTVEVYDETTNAFGAVQTMPPSSVGGITTSERRDHAAVKLADGRILVFGGRGGPYLDTMFLVTDGVVASAVMSAKLPEGLSGMNTAVLPDGSVISVSGSSQDSGGGQRYSRKAFRITVSGIAATVTPIADAPVPRLRAHGFVAPVGPHSGRAIFVGGAITSPTNERVLISSQGGIIYDATANKWLPLPLLSKVRYLGVADLLAGGRLLFTGGTGDVAISGPAHQDAELLDLNSMAWKPAGTMVERRVGHSGIVLNDGSMLLIGGVSEAIDGFLTLTTGSERFTLQPAAATCASHGECQSGFCADGVCCDKACGGQCEACDVTGSVGTCKPVTGEPHGVREKCRIDVLADPGCNLACNGTDVAACQYPTSTATCSVDACAAGRETHASTCDGGGKCNDVPKACGDYTCDVKTCKTTCASKADCSNPGHFCEAGVCIPVQANGSACTRNEACASANCVDGICCESKCEGQCQACDVPGQVGKCVAIKGKPHGTRADCEKDAADACKSKACDGTNTASCAGTVGPCSNYACDDVAKECKRACLADIDCGSGFQCDPATAQCVPRTSRCVGNDEIQSADGTKAKCTAFICRDGACLSNCTTTNECQNGFVCDGAGACVAPSNQVADEGGCAMGNHGTALPGVALTMLLLGLVRRRVARKCAVYAAPRDE